MTSRITAYTRKKTARFIGSMLVILLSVLFLAALIIRIFTIRDIVIDAPGMSIELDRKKFGKNLIFLPTETLRANLLSAYPLLLNVTFERRFPGTLVVHFVKRPIFALLESEQIAYAIDDQGLVLESVGKKNIYPLLLFDVGILTAGGRVTDERVIASLSFLRGLKNKSEISVITLKNAQWLHAQLGNTSILLPQKGDLLAKADTLQIITEGFRMKGTLPAVIDLRFEKPVITNY